MHAVYQILCKELDYDFPSDREVFRKMYGRDYKDLYVSLGIPKNLWDKGSEIYYREIVKRNSLPFSLIKKQLSILSKKYKLFVVSATSREEVVSKIKKNNLDSYFMKIFARKHHSEVFSKANIIKSIIRSEGIH